MTATATIQLFAQPYDIDAEGFYFTDADDYTAKAAACRNAYGDQVEEYEIQFIDGEAIDAQLAEAWGLNQVNFARFLDVADAWDDHGKLSFIIAVGECGCDFNHETVAPQDFDVDIYEVDTMKDLAMQFVDDGLFGEIPDHLANYIDYDAIARDLEVDYSITIICSRRYAYRCS